MKHRTKQWLILLYTVLTIAGVACCVNWLAWAEVLFGFVWPEIMALAFIRSIEEMTALGVAIAFVSGAGLLLHLAAPVCGYLRVYWPFKVLLCVKAVLSLAAFLLVPAWYTGLFLLLHGALFVLTMLFFDRSVPENVPDAELAGAVPGDRRLHPSQTERMDGGYPDC